MNERYRYDSALEKVYDDETFNGESTENYGVFECCEIMNEQYEQIQQLKQENEQLKSFKEQNINEYLKLKEVCNECQKENERLKSENKILKEDLEHCANQFTDDGKNILLSLRWCE